MPQDEQNRLWEQESFFCMDNLGAMRFHHCSGVCTAFYPCITLGQLILPRAGHSQCSGTAGKADYIRPWAQGIPCWTLHGVVEPQTVPAAESKRGQEKRLWSLWKHLMLSQLPGLWNVIKRVLWRKSFQILWKKPQTNRYLTGFRYFLSLDLL